MYPFPLADQGAVPGIYILHHFLAWMCGYALFHVKHKHPSALITLRSKIHFFESNLLEMSMLWHQLQSIKAKYVPRPMGYIQHMF